MTKLVDLDDAAPIVLVRSYPSLDVWAEKGSLDLLSHIDRVLEKKKSVSIGLSGGNTPIPFFTSLAKKLSQWHPSRKGKIYWFFSDERCVPPDHPQSNYRMARETLFIPGQIPDETIFRIHGESPHPEREALRYERILSENLGSTLPHPPILDLILLGVGPDGHTASLFPGTSPEEDRHRLVLPVPPTDGRIGRISLSYRTLAEAGKRIFLVTGSTKKATLESVLNPEGTLPSQWVLRESEARSHPSEFWIDRDSCPSNVSQWADVRME